MSLFFNLLNGYSFIVVRRGARETGKGTIIKRLATLAEAMAMARALSSTDNENFYWGMHEDEY